MPFSSANDDERNNPVWISQRLLEITGAFMMAGDFERFADNFDLPQHMETFEGQRLVTTREEFRVIFDAVRTYYQVNGVTHLVRHCISAEFKSEDCISATHETRVLNGVRLVQKPFPAYSTLLRIDGRWKVKSCIYAIEDAPDHNRALIKPRAS